MTIAPILTLARKEAGDGYWYLATPYSKYPGGIVAAFEEACLAAGYLIRNGLRVYSPIAHTHPIAMASRMDPLDHAIWLPVDQPFMDNACGLIVCQMPTWEISYGIRKEIETFEAAHKPIHYMDWLLDDTGTTRTIGTTGDAERPVEGAQAGLSGSLRSHANGLLQAATEGTDPANQEGTGPTVVQAQSIKAGE